jgi:EAL domain-containing protein (putative c-di-GMP-specific phosphodiesterase class I)
MKQLDINTILNSQIIPYYQPIISLQSRRIIGYESLGRYMVDGTPVSLGPFFHSPHYSEKEHLQIDRLLRLQAIDYMARSSEDSLLFINLRPSWIFNAYKSSGVLPTLLFLEESNLSMDRIVIEITEDEFHGSSQELSDLVNIYRQKGCKIAIDDVGSGFSTFDRIAWIEPDIIKIDLKLMKYSRVHKGYRALLRSYSIVAEQIGASLLMEGIENEFDLQQAITIGARYVQGFYFSPAINDYLPPDMFSEVIHNQLNLYAGEQIAKYQELHVINQLFDKFIITSSSGIPIDPDPFIEQFLHKMPLRCVRIYLCQEDGTQVSAKYSRDPEHMWQKDTSFRGANWIWRPYFIPNIVRLQYHHTPMMSQIYADLETNAMMYTYSGMIHSDLYLFFDLTI